MRRRSILGALAALTLSACAASRPAPEAIANADLINYRSVLALRANRTDELRSFMGNTSFLIATLGGRTEHYFAPDGSALIFDSRDGDVVTGQWQVIDARFGADLICWTPGAFPEPMSGQSFVDLCEPVSEFVGLAFYLSRGDTFELSAGPSGA